jgi:hypothetical protein
MRYRPPKTQAARWRVRLGTDRRGELPGPHGRELGALGAGQVRRPPKRPPAKPQGGKTTRDDAHPRNQRHGNGVLNDQDRSPQGTEGLRQRLRGLAQRLRRTVRPVRGQPRPDVAELDSDLHPDAPRRLPGVVGVPGGGAAGPPHAVADRPERRPRRGTSSSSPRARVADRQRGHRRPTQEAKHAAAQGPVLVGQAPAAGADAPAVRALGVRAHVPDRRPTARRTSTGWRRGRPGTIAFWNVGVDGEVASIQQWPAGHSFIGNGAEPRGHAGAGPGRRRCDHADRLVIYQHEPDPASRTATACCGPAYKHWILKDRAMRIEIAALGRYGIGVPGFTASEDESEDQDRLDEYRDLAMDYTGGENSGFSIPRARRSRSTGPRARRRTSCTPSTFTTARSASPRWPTS